MHDRRTNDKGQEDSALRENLSQSAEDEPQADSALRSRPQLGDPLGALGEQLESLGRALSSMSNFDVSAPIVIRGTRDSVDNLARSAFLLQQQLREVNEQLENVTQALFAMSAFNFSTPISSRGTSDPVDGLADAARLLQEELARAAVPASHVQSLLSSMPSPAGMLDLRGRIVQQNRHMERLLRTNGNGDFMAWLNGCLPEGREMEISEWRDPVQISYKMGEIELHYLFFVAPLRSHFDDTEGYAVVGIDMTQQVWTQKELERAQEIAESHARARFSFVTNMSHEIRTPLHGILGSAELLLGGLSAMDIDPSDIEKHVKTIQLCGQHLHSLITDIMDFSHIDGNRITLEQKPFDLPALLRECMQSAERAHSSVQEGVITRGPASATAVVGVRPSGVTARVTIADDVPSFLTGDQKRLKQVITNLLSNAFKFTDQGVVELRALLVERTDGQTHPPHGQAQLRIEIIDTGIGIPEDKQTQLFEAFEQVDVSSTRSYGGTGLGLAIVRGLVEIMQGRLGVHSRPGEGSTFWFEVTLPLAAEAGREEERPFDESRIQGVNILLVEDNMVSRRIVQRMLQKVGCKVTVAGDGEEALKRAAETTFDIILMDCQMPVMDGITATKELRKRKHRTPVIALTADAQEDSRIRCMEAGMNDYLPKPVGKESLCRVIDKHFHKSA
jgi:signal transduction histidine kinase/BarA-like signal transduction histidine kinase